MAARAQPAPIAGATGGTDDYGPQGRSAWMDVDWREHQRWVDVEGSPVNVIDIGPRDPSAAEAGIAVVFVHGLSGSWQNWLENVPACAADRRVIAMDLPGFGASPMPVGEISIAGYARSVDALLNTLGVDASVVVGNSMGGFVAAELAIAFPERVERLVLVSAAGISTLKLRDARRLSVLRRAHRVVTMYGGWLASSADVVASRGRLRQFVFSIIARHPDQLPAPLVAEQVRGSGKAGFMTAVDALTSYPIEERLAAISCPTLIVWGTHDQLVPVGDADRFQALIGNSRKLVYADTGHVPMIERPARFNDDLLAFLDEEPGERIGAPSEESAADAAEVHGAGGEGDQAAGAGARATRPS